MQFHSLQPDTPSTLGQCFSANLSAVLAVAGAPREGDKPGPFPAARMQRETGIARSTLRALKVPGVDANPDLATISRLADALGVPPAFLLMRPQDWSDLATAFADSRDYMTAAEKLRREDKPSDINVVELVLRECKVHPDVLPRGASASSEVVRAKARDEWRRRACLKLDALMLRHASSVYLRPLLTAMAGAFVARSTPNDPS